MSTSPGQQRTDASEQTAAECPGPDNFQGMENPLAAIRIPEGAHHLAFLPDGASRACMGVTWVAISMSFSS